MRTWTFKTMTKMSSYGVIQQLRGPSFTQFWPPPHSSGQLWTFYMISTLLTIDQEWTLYCPPPPLLVHVVIEWPLSTTYTNLAKSHHPYVVGTYELYNLNLVRIWPQQNVVRVRLSSNMISRWHTQLAQQCSIENEIQNDQHFPSTSLFTWKVDRMP